MRRTSYGKRLLMIVATASAPIFGTEASGTTASARADEAQAQTATSSRNVVSLRVTVKPPAKDESAAPAVIAHPKTAQPLKPAEEIRVAVKPTPTLAPPRPKPTNPSVANSAPAAAKPQPAEPAADSKEACQWTRWENGRPYWRGAYNDARQRQGKWTRWFHAGEGNMFEDSELVGFERPLVATGMFDIGVFDVIYSIGD